MRRICLFLIVFLLLERLSAQEELSPFGPVTPADFSPVSSLVKPETEAVILKDSGSAVLEGYEYGFRIVYQRFRRIKIQNSRGLDAATISIGFSAEDNQGKRLKSIKAYTYNLENGQVNKVFIEKQDLFIDKKSKDDYKEEKFAFKNVRAGSIIEYSYSRMVVSFDLPTWYFQAQYPTLNSSFTVQVPDIFNYVIQMQGGQYLWHKKEDSVKRNIVGGTTWYLSTIHTTTWSFRDVPAIKEEPFTSTIQNYIACVRFQLSGEPAGPGKMLRVLSDWQMAANLMLQSERFGVPITRIDPWIIKQTKTLVLDSDSSLQRARKIFAFVRNHFTVTYPDCKLSPDMSLKDIYMAGHGNVADINLLLISMLKSQGIQTDPVILATRDNGLTNVQYPILENFNYLICRVQIGGHIYYLDASDATDGFGIIPINCYNGHARVIATKNYPVFLSPDSLKESGRTLVYVYNSDAQKKMSIECTHVADFDESSDIRSSMKEMKTKSYFSKITEKMPFEKTIDSTRVSDLENPDLPVTTYYKISFDPGSQNLIYFNPLLNSGLAENPFKSEQRNYPVELPYTSDETFILNMEVPEGYEVDELPKSARLLLNESDAVYEYLIEASAREIRLKSHLALRKAVFSPEDYASLKNFYANMIKKESEMIVFKKITR